MVRDDDGSFDFVDELACAGQTPARADSKRIVEHDQSETRSLEGLGTRPPRTGARHFRWGANRFAHRSARRNSGTALVFLILVWLPIFALFAVILWLRAVSLNHVLTQRKLDRCLHALMSARCSTLTLVSESNQRLKQLILAIAAIETAKQATSAIPVAGVGLAVAGESAAEVLREIANGVAKGQDVLVAIENARALKALGCGVPMNGIAKLAFKRPQTVFSSIAKATPALSWDEGVAASETHLRSWTRFRIESFAHCQSEKPEESGQLDGENYEASFRHAPAKSSSKVSSFSP